MDQRIALYVYEKSDISIDPNGTIDLMKMNNDYTASSLGTISSPTNLSLDPGVYGFIWNGSHGVTASSGVTLVTDDYDLQRKNPWPTPPPPPPPPFSQRSDWSDHCDIFLVPLGSTFELGAPPPAANQE